MTIHLKYFEALTQIYRRTVDAVDAEAGLRFLRADARMIRVGDLEVQVLSPPHADLSQNDNSVGLWLKYGGFSAVFTGDSERGELEMWQAAYAMRSVSVMKAAHHGSWNGASGDWVSVLAPKVVVVSVGANNQYGHPDVRVLEAWRSVGARTYRTDSVGTVTVKASRNGGFSVTTQSGLLPFVLK